MFKQRLGGFVFFVAVVFIFGLGVGIFFPHWAKMGSTPKTYNTAVLLKQVQTLSQLVTVKYVLEKIEVLSDPPQNPLRAALPDDTHVTLIAHGIVKAGVDLARIKPADLRVSDKKIVLALPPAQITDAYLDDKLTQVVERNTG